MKGGDCVTVTQEMTRTPENPPPDYNWTKEPWVNDSAIRDLSVYLANHVMVALAAKAETAQKTEDMQVWLLLNPQITEKVAKGPYADGVIRYRVACAMAQGLDFFISQWVKKMGSIDHKGPPKDPKFIARDN